MNATNNRLYIGTASWSVPKIYRDNFLAGDSILEQYASRFRAVEINSCFYRDHKPETYQRWAESVPGDFRFSVKLSKELTHVQRLAKGEKSFRDVFSGFKHLGEKLGCILIQLPPSLEYEPETSQGFFADVRSVYLGPIALEPRHNSWLNSGELMNQFKISPVVADPEVAGLRKLADESSTALTYFRLHGSPAVYKSNYELEDLINYAGLIDQHLEKKETWCIFDNTTYGLATINALALQSLLAKGNHGDRKAHSLHDRI